MHGNQPHPAPLIKADRVDVVIRRDHPQAPAAILGDLFSYPGQKRGADPAPLPQRVQRHQFALGVLGIPIHDELEFELQLG